MKFGLSGWRVLLPVNRATFMVRFSTLFSYVSYFEFTYIVVFIFLSLYLHSFISVRVFIYFITFMPILSLKAEHHNFFVPALTQVCLLYDPGVWCRWRSAIENSVEKSVGPEKAIWTSSILLFFNHLRAQKKEERRSNVLGIRWTVG